MAIRLIIGVVLLILLLLAAGCATLNVSSFETAIPSEELGPEFIVSVSSGIDLDDLFFPESTWVRRGWDKELEYLIPTPCFQLKSYQSDRFSAGGKVWTTLGCIGGNVYGKLLLEEYGMHYLALMPGTNLMAGFAERQEGDQEDVLFFNYTLGAELQLLYTLKFSENFSATLIGRGAGDYYYQEKMEDHYHEEDYEESEIRNSHGLWRYGGRANLRIRAGSVYLIPEGGVEVLRPRHGKTLLEPIAGLGIEF